MLTKLEYIWLDSKLHLRSKQRSCNNMEIISRIPKNENVLTLDSLRKDEILLRIPLWNCDGSSTGQADTQRSEITLKPVNIIFRILFIEFPKSFKTL